MFTPCRLYSAGFRAPCLQVNYNIDKLMTDIQTTAQHSLSADKKRELNERRAKLLADLHKDGDDPTQSGQRMMQKYMEDGDDDGAAFPRATKEEIDAFDRRQDSVAELNKVLAEHHESFQRASEKTAEPTPATQRPGLHSMEGRILKAGETVDQAGERPKTF